MSLATVEQLRERLRTAGSVSAGANLDEGLLASLLAGAERRIRLQLPERTLDMRPALVGDPLEDTGEPVELRIPLYGRATSIVRVPDLRELTSIDVSPAAAGGAIDLPELTALGTYTLIRRPGQACALWVRFPSPVLGEELVIVGRWGPAELELDGELAVNDAVNDAVLVWAARAFHNRTARYADTMQDPAGGVASYFRNLPPDVASTIEALRVPGI